MSNNWRLSTFKSLVGQSVVASELQSENSCNLEIIEVIESNHLGEGWETFSVIFKCELPIEQGSLALRHDDHGSMVAFLSPKSDTELESVFSYDILAVS